MTDSNFTVIAFVADRSGSMGEPAEGFRTKAQDTTTGVREMVRAQQALPGRVAFSLSDFNTTVRQVESLGDGTRTLAWECAPSGGTALLDAAANGIRTLGMQLEAMPGNERPGKVVFVLATDGHENSSHHTTKAQLKDMISHQQGKYGWQFVFIGTGIDAFADAGSFGIAYGSTMSNSAAGTRMAYASTNDAVTRFRGGVTQSVTYTTDEQEQAARK